MKLETFYEELKLQEFLKDIDALNDKDTGHTSNVYAVLSAYVNYIYSIIQNASFEKTIAIMDVFNNNLPRVSVSLLEKNDEKIYRAALVLEAINGRDIESIKTDESDLDFMLKFLHQSDVGENFKLRDELLREYLNSKDENEVNATLQSDLAYFGQNLPKINEVIFGYDITLDYLPRAYIINFYFLNFELDLDSLNKIYSEVLLKNKNLSSFSYEKILDPADGCRNEVFLSIKGLFRKCGDNFFEAFDISLDKEEFEEYNEFLKVLVKNNKDDDNGLCWFFGEINNYASPEMKEFLREQDYFQKYTSISLDSLYDDVIEKLLSGRKDVDPIFLNGLGSYRGFIEKYDLFLKKFDESMDSEYQELLLLPLTIGLMEKQKERYNLDFKITTTTSAIDNNVLGSYSNETKVMYVNPLFFKSISDKKLAFANAAVTTFHETRHALQYFEAEQQNNYSYENLLILMDILLSKNRFSGYYQKNYQICSLEQDARDVSYVEAMKFFESYDSIQKHVLEENDKRYILTNFVRKNTTLGIHYSIIDSFLSFFDSNVSLLSKYPILQEYFEIDEAGNKIVPKSDKYFSQKKDEIELLPDSIEKREKLYSIKMFQFALDVDKYLKSTELERFAYFKDYGELDSVEMEQKIIENVGKMPTRR